MTEFELLDPETAGNAVAKIVLLELHRLFEEGGLRQASIQSIINASSELCNIPDPAVVSNSFSEGFGINFSSYKKSLEQQDQVQTRIALDTKVLTNKIFKFSSYKRTEMTKEKVANRLQLVSSNSLNKKFTENVGIAFVDFVIGLRIKRIFTEAAAGEQRDAILNNMEYSRSSDIGLLEKQVQKWGIADIDEIVTYGQTEESERSPDSKVKAALDVLEQIAKGQKVSVDLG